MFIMNFLNTVHSFQLSIHQEWRLSSELSSLQRRVNMFLVLAVLWQHQDGASANESSVEIRCLNPEQTGSVSKVTRWTQQPMALATEG